MKIEREKLVESTYYASVDTDEILNDINRELKQWHSDLLKDCARENGVTEEDIDNALEDMSSYFSSDENSLFQLYEEIRSLINAEFDYIEYLDYQETVHTSYYWDGKKEYTI